MPIGSRQAQSKSADSIFSCSRLLLESFVRFILGSRSRMNKTHIGWRPKWFAIQIGVLPNWRRQEPRQLGTLAVLGRVLRPSSGRYPLIAVKLRRASGRAARSLLENADS